MDQGDGSDRLLTRLLAGAPGRWVVKGGYANELRRPDDARFTEDLDCLPRATHVLPGPLQADAGTVVLRP
jgi:hypothetical protein